MRRFCRVVISLVFVSTVSIGSVYYCRSRVFSLLTVVFTNPDGSPCQLPCLFGVTPETDRSNALALLHVHPLVRQLDFTRLHNSSIRFIGPGMTVSVDRSYSPPWAPLLTSLDLFPVTESSDSRLNFGPPIVLLGDVLYTLGPPDAVYAGNSNVRLLYYGNHLLIGFRVVTRPISRFDADNPISTIMLTSQPEGFAPVGKSTRWFGFAAITRYVSVASTHSN